MKFNNKTLIYIFVIGLLLGFIGAFVKLEGGPQFIYSSLLLTSVLLQTGSVLTFLIRNFSELRLLFKER